MSASIRVIRGYPAIAIAPCYRVELVSIRHQEILRLLSIQYVLQLEFQ